MPTTMSMGRMNPKIIVVVVVAVVVVGSCGGGGGCDGSRFLTHNTVNQFDGSTTNP